ncbi:MAG: helix-turn-helix domain-containing protein [Minisyncoccia bacterium]
MEEFSIKELEKIINNGDFNSLIGKIENDFFECKGEIYDLKSEYSKRELAKDISSFANLNGGYILIGPKTKKSETHFGDEVKEISFINKEIIDIEQYNGVINDWIYPKVDGVRIKWIATKEEDKGILIIKIPPQRENQKPFLIKKIVEENKNVEIMFGYTKRKQDKSEPLKIEDIHRAMRDGFFYEEHIENRFNNLESILIKDQEEKRNKDRDTINKRINQILNYMANNKRGFILIAYPKEKLGELKSLFTSEEGSIKRKLEDPPLNAGKIRYAGWSLETLDRGRIVEGQFVRVKSGDTKIIDLYKDGTLIFLGLADENFLAWSSNDGLRINPIAVVELIYNFISFYREVINDLTIKPSIISVEFRFFNMHLDGKKSYLVPGPIDALSPFNTYEAPANNYSSETPIDFKVEDFETEKTAEIAYKVVEKIYLWFGIPLDKGNIPYTKIENAVVSIDIEQIRKK